VLLVDNADRQATADPNLEDPTPSPQSSSLYLNVLLAGQSAFESHQALVNAQHYLRGTKCKNFWKMFHHATELDKPISVITWYS